MAGTAFTQIYPLVRVATGNDDPIIGVETLPDTRIDVLLTSAALTIKSYSADLPTMDVDVSGTPYTVAVNGLALSTPLVIALAHAAAHKYFVGITNRAGIEESLGMVYSAADTYIGEGASVVSANEADLASATIYLMRKKQEAQSQKNLR